MRGEWLWQAHWEKEAPWGLWASCPCRLRRGQPLSPGGSGCWQPRSLLLLFKERGRPISLPRACLCYVLIFQSGGFMGPFFWLCPPIVEPPPHR